MNYTRISPLGPRVGHGTFETFFDSKKYKGLSESEAANDYVVCDFVIGEDDLKYIECYHIQFPDNKKYHRINYQNFPFGLDALDDSLAAELAQTLFLDRVGPPKEEPVVSESRDFKEEIEEITENRKRILSESKFSFKTHTLRWLFYRKPENWMIGKDGWKASQMCKECKKGFSSYMAFHYRDASGAWHNGTTCPYCKKPLERIPNTNFDHKVYKFLMKCSDIFWMILDKVHLIRHKHHSRYGFGTGDESCFVNTISTNFRTGKTTYELYKRKWWEYIFIKKPRTLR